MVACLRCLLHHILSFIAYTFRENWDFVFIIIVQFMMSPNSRIRFLDLIHLFVHYTISLSSLCKHIWRHWTFKMPIRYIFVKCVSKIKHILSVIHYTIYGAMCFQFNPSVSLVMIERMYNLSYYYHQIGSMNYNPLFRVRLWNNGKDFMSLYILFMSLIVLYFLHSTSVLSFYIDIVLTISVGTLTKISMKIQRFFWSKTYAVRLCSI